MASELLDRENLISEIWKKRGKVSLVAEALGVSTVTIYSYAKKYSTVKQALTDAQNHEDTKLVDTAELAIAKAAVNGEAWAVKYILNTKGKERGWVERREIEHSGRVDFSTLTDEELEAIASGSV